LVHVLYQAKLVIDQSDHEYPCCMINASKVFTTMSPYDQAMIAGQY